MAPVPDDAWKDEPGVEDFLTARRKSASEHSVGSYATHLVMARQRSPKLLLDLSVREASKLAAALKEELRSADTLGRTMGLFYRFHGRKDLAEAVRIRTPKKRLSPGAILVPSDVNALLQAADTLRDRALVAILWESAARIHEVLALDWGDLSEVHSPENGGRVFVKAWFKKAKVAGEERSCLLVEAAPHLLRWRDGYPVARGADSPVFITAEHAHFGDRLGYAGARHILKDLGPKAGLKKAVRPHLFRHSAITHLLRAGWTEAKVKQAVGLSPGSRQLSTYAHLVDEDVDRARLEMHGLQAPERAEEVSLADPGDEDLPGMPAEDGFAAQVRALEDRIDRAVEAKLRELLKERDAG